MAVRRKPGATAPQVVPPKLSGVLLCGLRRAVRQEPMVKSTARRLLEMGLIETVPDRFSRITQRGLEALRNANQKD